MKHLINKKTGVVFTWTDVLANHKDMVPHVLGEKREPEASVPEPSPEPKKPMSELDAEKEHAADLVKEWFGRDVARVTIADLIAYAKDKHGVELTGDSKLKLVQEIEGLGNDG